MTGRQCIDQNAIAQRIHSVRHCRVLLDFELAELYGVPTGALIQAVKRNHARFPSDFMFHLTEQEVAILKSQSVISSSARRERWGGRRKPVNAFTEQGVAMLSSVLRSPRAVAANIAIMRAFVQLRYLAAANDQQGMTQPSRTSSRRYAISRYLPRHHRRPESALFAKTDGLFALCGGLPFAVWREMNDAFKRKR
jgi:hypothetical protein